MLSLLCSLRSMNPGGLPASFQLPSRPVVTEVDEDWKSWTPSQRKVVRSSLGCSQPCGCEQRQGASTRPWSPEIGLDHRGAQSGQAGEGQQCQRQRPVPVPPISSPEVIQALIAMAGTRDRHLAMTTRLEGPEAAPHLRTSMILYPFGQSDRPLSLTRHDR